MGYTQDERLERLRRALALLEHGRTMYRKAKCEDDRTVIWYGVIALERTAQVWLESLGGLGADW